MIGSGMSILCFIAFRMITQHGSVEVAIEKGRRTIHELCTHSNERKASDYLQRTVMSAFLLRIMQKGGFFGRRTSESGNFHLHFTCLNKLDDSIISSKENGKTKQQKSQQMIITFFSLPLKHIQTVKKSLRSVVFLLDYFKRSNSMPTKSTRQKRSKVRKMSAARVSRILVRHSIIQLRISTIHVIRM